MPPRGGADERLSKYWGIRNLALAPWLSLETLRAYRPDYVGFQVGWSGLEPLPGEFNWKPLDVELGKAMALGAEPVVVLLAGNRWACEPSPPPPAGLKQGDRVTPPKDLDRSTALDAPQPEQGYSRSLYAFTRSLVLHVAAQYRGRLWLRFVNEPVPNWHLGSDTSLWPAHLEDYERCLRTFAKAAHDAAKQRATEVRVSHGGIVLDRYLEEIWFDRGERNPAQRTDMLDCFRSFHERPHTIGDHFVFSDWQSVRAYMRAAGPGSAVGERGELAGRAAAWAPVFERLSEWVDYQDVHWHFKPRFLQPMLEAFDASLLRSGRKPKPWLSAETGMKVLGRSARAEERFQAGDMARKWMSGMRAGLLGIVTPVVGSPPQIFRGLYQSDNQGSKEFEAAKTFRLLRRYVPVPGRMRDMSTAAVVHLRFEAEAPVDVLWRDVLFDADDAAVPWQIEYPSGATSVKVLDVLGNEAASVPRPGAVLLHLTQEPRLLIWSK